MTDTQPFPVSGGTIVPKTPAYRAYLLLRNGFTALPILAGVDKFTHWLVNWDQYLAPAIARSLPMDAHAFMQLVGIIEIMVGVIVGVAPRIGGYLVAGWLWGIIINLLLIPGYLDIALRDVGLSLGAIALARLATQREWVERIPRQPPSAAREEVMTEHLAR